MNSVPQYIKNQIEHYAIYFLKKHLENNYNPCLPAINLNFFVDSKEQTVIKISEEISTNEEKDLSDARKKISKSYKALYEEITDIPNSKELAFAISEITDKIRYNLDDKTIYIPKERQRYDFLESINDEKGGTSYAGGEWIEEKIVKKQIDEKVVGVFNEKDEHIETITFPNKEQMNEYLTDEKGRLKQINAKCLWWDNEEKQILLENEEYLKQRYLNKKNEIEFKSLLEDAKLGNYYEHFYNQSFSYSWAYEVKVLTKTKETIKVQFYISIRPLEINKAKKTSKFEVLTGFDDFFTIISLPFEMKKRLLSATYQQIINRGFKIAAYADKTIGKLNEFKEIFNVSKEYFNIADSTEIPYIPQNTKLRSQDFNLDLEAILSPEEFKAVIAYKETGSIKEAAKNLSKDISTIKTQLANAREKVKTFLNTEDKITSNELTKMV